MRIEATSLWSIPQDEVLASLASSPAGLGQAEARARLRSQAKKRLGAHERRSSLALLAAQFTSPIIALLVIAAAVSFGLGGRGDAAIILSIIVASALLGYWQEHKASDTVARLLAIVRTKALVVRDGSSGEVFLEEIVPGDVVLLAAGDAVPGDARLLESKDLFVGEAELTGETFPAEKQVGTLAEDTPLARRSNMLFLGTHVASGSARAVVLRVGRDTELGKISARLQHAPPETEFERGVRRFGLMLLEVTVLLVAFAFAANVWLGHPVLEGLLFSLALAVGMTPQLLPAIISVNLSHGARRMAELDVIVKRLSSIENFGSMNVLCCDKTGTLTEGVVRIHGACDAEGAPSQRALHFARINAECETGFHNPIDDAIRRAGAAEKLEYTKIDEVPYDFVRKRLSVLVSEGGRRTLITKGAVPNILEVCSHVAACGGAGASDPWCERTRRAVELLREGFAKQGLRALGIAVKDLGDVERISSADEHQMTFVGFLTVFDPPKSDAADTLRELAHSGVRLKMVTGDSTGVAAYVAQAVGLRSSSVLTGTMLRKMSDEALVRRARDVDVFAEVEPNQKERIILALRKSGNVVGYVGDGINDASALHAADVGISVNGAADVAREAADIILLEKNLSVLVDGVREGRVTFANTQKYVFMATSANFGNMFSMAGASLFMPFLPLLPKQILLTNPLTDLPEMAIASDRVDPDWTERPRRWDMRFIRTFMLVFGALSSVFDYLTFGLLLFVLKADEADFRTGWFVESVLSASLIVLVIRSHRPLFTSRPGRWLVATTIAVAIGTLILPYTPLASLFGLQPLTFRFLAALSGLLALYALAAEALKHWFHRHYGDDAKPRSPAA
jgi:Mg2+-importing ATPase